MMKVSVLCLISGALATVTQAASLHRRASGSSEAYYIAYCFSTEQYSYTGTEIDYYQNGTNGQTPEDTAPVLSAQFNLGADNPGASLNATFQDSGIKVAIEIPLVSLYSYIIGINSNFSDTGLSVGSLTRYSDSSSWNCVADNFSTLYYTSSVSCQSFAHCIPSNSSSSNSSSSGSCGW